MARGGSQNRGPKPALANEDIKLMEEAISALPRGRVSAGEAGSADKLLKYGYHQNPYVRLFTKVLWSGYAISRGQLAESDARFKQARNDATMSNIDRTTVRALDDAHAALQQSLAPDGSTAAFLDELRQRTIQRMWARVCETANLPPPSFTSLLRKQSVMTPEEIAAAEQAEIDALMKTPALPEPEPANGDESAESDGGEAAAAPEAEATADDTADAAASEGVPSDESDTSAATSAPEAEGDA